MKLRTKYILFVVILHGLTLVLSYFVFREKKILFIASEGLVILSALIAWRLYRELIRPLKTLMQGVDAIRDQDFNVKFVHTGKHEMDQLIDVYNQMIEKLRSERVQQAEQHYFLEKLVSTSPTGIMILDYNGDVQQVNPKALQLMGLREYNEDSVLAHPMFLQARNLQSGEARTVTLDSFHTYKIQKSHFIDRGFPRHFVMIEELTAEILATEKKVYEKVIRMMAHEVNNTVGPVNSIIGSALKADTLFPQLREAMEVAIARNENLNVFMRNFADLVKLPEPSKRTIDIHRLLRSVARLMEARATEKHAVIELDVPAGEWLLQADEQLLEQAFINILKNSLEAVSQNGVIRITSQPSPCEIVIADNGSGIADEAAAQLFSPFYSTKKDGQGIGLTLVREILLNHGYTFALKTYGVGDTRFTIKL
ncbi:ATP-binding protein [Chitinophaga horti]|uniref:histidine kinase n=1 Tax=Chitinophaga horti TaxID=2920382 RepID=A0ABY6J9A2_9BACT|nr:ATP-binding protein [Chitinophaga horti]UYQ95911.1 ATP-binding protein [Chitinophaga horti]